MSYAVDIPFEFNLSKSKLFKASLLFSLLFTAIIVGDVLLIALSGEDYLPCLIVSIVITILFVWFAIYFFTNIYNDLNSRYRYFRGYESGLKSDDEVVFIKSLGVLEHVNGVYVYPIMVKYVTTLTSEVKTIYTFEKDLPFVEGDKLTIRTYQRVLLKADKHQ